VVERVVVAVPGAKDELQILKLSLSLLWRSERGRRARGHRGLPCLLAFVEACQDANRATLTLKLRENIARHDERYNPLGV